MNTETPPKPETIEQVKELLNKATIFIDRAIEAHKANDHAAVQVAIDHLIYRLYELFYHRKTMGDGFGMVVNSLMTAMRNQGRTPLTLPQLNATWKTIRCLGMDPPLDELDALGLIDILENVGLNPYGLMLDDMADCIVPKTLTPKEAYRQAMQTLALYKKEWEDYKAESAKRMTALDEEEDAPHNMEPSDMEDYTKRLTEKLQSPEGKRKLEEIKECSKAVKKRFEKCQW